MKTSDIKKVISYDKVRALAMDSFESTPTVEFLDSLGISMDEADPHVKYIMSEGLAKNPAFAVDAATPTVTSGSVVTAAQFLQYWMPKGIEVITQARMADKLFGRTVCGSWEDEEVIQPVVEYTGTVGIYGDSTDTPLASFTQSFEKRTILRFEEGLISGKLEDARAAASNLRKSAHDLKRAAVARAFAIAQNAVAFYGFNNGTNITYGALNDANMLPYASTTTSGWNSASYAELVRELNTAISQLRTQSGDNADMQEEKMTLAVASCRVDYLGTANEHGETVGDWLKRKHPNIRIVSVPEFDGACGGLNVFYLYFENLEGNKVFHQLVPSVMRLVGVEIKSKGLREDYSNALAGTLCAQPLGCVRVSGI